MAINTTEAERQRQLAQDFAQKLALERSFDIDLRRLFREINQDFRAELARTGQVIRASEFNADMVALLRRHYRRVLRKFGRQIRTELKSSNGHREYKREHKQTNEEIAEAQRLFIQQTSEQHARLILQTTQDNLNNKTQEAQQEFNEENPLASTINDAALAAIALSASLGFRQLIPGKATIISATEVQNSAEQFKLNEATGLEDGGEIENPEKQWATILDERTRLSHVDADGQIQPLRQPFNVQNQSLRRPGDTSLGATLDNIINCRCSSLTIIG